MPVHDKLKKLRKGLNLSQQQLAEKLHISQNAYSAIETGKTKIDENRIHQLANILKIPFIELIAGQEATNKLESTSNVNTQPTFCSSEMKICLLETELDIKNFQLKVFYKRLSKRKL